MNKSFYHILVSKTVIGRICFEISDVYLSSSETNRSPYPQSVEQSSLNVVFLEENKKISENAAFRDLP